MFQISRVPQNAQLIVAILVVFALPSSKMYACAQVQEEAKIVKEDKTDQDEIIVIEAEPDAKVETDSNAAAAPPVMEKRDAPEEDIKEEDINKPWVEIVSPATQEANESDASSNAAAAKGITLKDLSWLFPLLAVLLILLVLGWLLALMTRFIHRNDKYTDENVGQTEAEFGRIFLGRPSSVDDLTRIEGVDSGMQGRLNAAGIYQFAQLKNMTPGQRAVLGRKVGLPRLGRAAASSFGALAEVDSSGTAGVTGSVAGVVAASAAAAGAAVASSAKSVSAKSVSAESSSSTKGEVGK